jgi:hypothetical protein
MELQPVHNKVKINANDNEYVVLMGILNIIQAKLRVLSQSFAFSIVIFTIFAARFFKSI